ncbi:MAG: RHS repeat-associated core domain-containing protein [Limisphaerales bacterium]
MKTLSCRCAAVVVGCSLLLAAGQVAHAEISVDSTSSFSDVTIDPMSGTIQYMGVVQSSAYAQAGGNSQFESVDPSSASASDVPAPGASATGSGSGSAGFLSGSSGATGYVPGATAGYDTSTGRGTITGAFQIIGTTGAVNVTFSAMVSGSLNLSSDVYGESGQGESDFTLSINGNPVLFNDQILSIGPDQTQNSTLSQTLTASMTLTADTTYYFVGEADAETQVVNSSVAAVPEPGEMALALEGMGAVGLIAVARKRRAARQAASRGLLMLLGGALLGLAAPAYATYIGSDRKDICNTCGAPPTRQKGGKMETSMTEGNMRNDYTVVTVQSAYGPTLPFCLTYNSYNADGSKMQLNTGLGFGWSHTYNTMLFQQRGQMFRLGADGRVTQYYQNYSGGGGSYVSDTGYFETLTRQPDGSYIVTNKYQSWWRYGSVSNSPLLIAGPVYQLLQMGDRNQNITTFTYNGSGELATATDPFGRTLQFTYNSSNKLSSITDPLGRTTTFQYDAMSRMPTQITDPAGYTTQYTYNAQDQLTREIDRDGRMYFYTYRGERPYMVTDDSGQPYFSMTDATDWAVDQTNLTYSLRRQYIPSTTMDTDGNGHVWQFAYDTNGYITQTIAPDGSTTRYMYDPGSLNVASKTDPNGNATSYRYDSQGNCIQVTDALGNVTTYTYDPVFNEVTSMTDPNGRITTNTYDSRGNRIQETDAIGQIQTWTYDANGNVLTWTDKRGYTTTNQYDASGDLIQTTDPLGHTTSYTYDTVGNRISMTDANGHTTTYTYDADNRLIQTTDALGHTNTTTYDGAGNVLTTTDADGHTTTYVYDQRGRVVATTNAVGGITQTTYDADDNVISRTDEDGHVTTYTYDTLNRLISTTDALGNVSRTTYDGDGNIISSTDGDGHTNTYTYDALNRRISSTDPLGNTTTYQYASIGGMPCCGATAGSDLVTGTVDGDGKYTYYHYDELNRRVQEVHKSGSITDTNTPSDAITTYTYDPVNNRIAVTDPNTNTTSYTYDPLNRVIGMTNAAGDVTTSVYDPVGNVIQTVDPRGNVTIYTYDADNRLITESDSVGPVLAESYDAEGNVISTTDGDGNVTTSTYDAINRVISTTDPLGNTTTTTYDADGNVISQVDRDGNRTTYTYDADNRQISVIDALGNTSTTEYDADGNVISVTDPLGHTTQYTYDADNRVIQETYADSPSDRRIYTYGATGHRISRLDQNGQTTTYQYNDFYYLTNRSYSAGPADQFTYDLGGRIISGSRNGWTDTFTYDGANRVLTAVQNGQTVVYTYVIPSGIRTITYPSALIITEDYDLRSRLMTVNDGGSPVVTLYTYDLDNNVLGRSNRNGTVATYSYNADRWVTNLTHSNTSVLIAGFAYAYDDEGNKTYQQNEAVSSNSESYAYDALYRLTNFDVGTLSGGVIPLPSIAESYNLDADGNWTSYTSNAVTQTRTDNAVDEVLTINTNTLTYDADGNLLDDGNYTHTYDGENRLTTVTRDSDSALVGQYTYDARGRRVIAMVNPGGTPATNVFFYDGNRILEEQNSGGATLATYTYGNYVDEALTMNRGGLTYYYHPNALFNIEALTDPTGAPVERYTYDVYGEPTVMDGSYNPIPLNAWGTPHSGVGNFYLFTGRQFDEESDLYFYRRRYYEAGLGRFLQRDPAGYAGGLNLYAYVKDRVTGHVDPYGMQDFGFNTTKELEALRKKGRFMTATKSLETPLTLAELQEMKALLENRRRNLAESLRLEELQVQFRNAGATFSGKGELEVLQGILGLVRKVTPDAGAGGALKKALELYEKGIGVAIKGIQKIDEEKYNRYAEARRGGACHEQAYTFRDDATGEAYRARYELEKLREGMPKVQGGGYNYDDEDEDEFYDFDDYYYYYDDDDW